ncbi:MAG: hypothetical protein LC772_10815 [Chloroflexi bacterium]|nr:hypothetical protein [Chloroflexota bacterium]
MSDPTLPAGAAPGDADVPAATLVRPKRRSPVRLPVVLLTLGLVAVVCFLAYYQDELGYFINLKLWDRGGPARTVHALLQGCSKNNESLATQQVDHNLQPLMKNGKWVGFFIHDPHFNRDTPYPFSSFVPKDPSAPGETEFVTRGDGAAEFTITGPTGQPEKFHMLMEKGSWKVDQIL